MTAHDTSQQVFHKRHDISVEEAIYSESKVEKYRGNPLIAALMPQEPWEIMAENLRNYPPYDPTIRTASAETRIAALADIMHFFYPRLIHRELNRVIQSLIRESYLTRNPIAPRYSQTARERIAAIKAGRPPEPVWQAIEMALINIGLPGMGKTTGQSSVYRTFPDLIIHHCYRDPIGMEHMLEFVQIPVLPVKCPEDGTTRTLLIETIRAIDRIVQGGYETMYVRKDSTKNTLIPIIATLFHKHHVGIYSLDELQNVSRAGSGGVDDMLSFFVRLTSDLKTALVLTGTDRVRPILTGALQQIRRGQVFGELTWRRMAKDVEWANLMQALWRYQYVQKVIEPLDVGITDAIYEESVGIMDYAIKLFMLAQVRAITLGSEQLSARAIHQTAQEHLSSARPILQAIRQNNDEYLQGLGISDLPPLDVLQVLDDARQKPMENDIESVRKRNPNEPQSTQETKSKAPRRPRRRSPKTDTASKETPHVRGRLQAAVAEGEAYGTSAVTALTDTGFVGSIDDL